MLIICNLIFPPFLFDLILNYHISNIDALPPKFKYFHLTKITTVQIHLLPAIHRLSRCSRRRKSSIFRSVSTPAYIYMYMCNVKSSVLIVMFSVRFLLSPSVLNNIRFSVNFTWDVVECSICLISSSIWWLFSAFRNFCVFHK